MASRELYWNPNGAPANWGDANVWSLTDGGTRDQSTPTYEDNIHFTSTNVYNCTVAASANCNNITFTGGTGYTGTFAGSSDLNIYGSFTLSSGMTITHSGSKYFLATSSGKTITFATKTLSGLIQFDGVGGEWTFQDTVDNGTSTITTTNGSLITNGQTITCGTFYITGTATRTVNINSSTINCKSWRAEITTNLTWSCTSSVIKVTGTGDFKGGGLTYVEVQLNGTSHYVYQSNTFATFTRTSTNTTTDDLVFYADQTITGTLNTIGYSNIKRPLIKSDTVGTQRTLTLTGATRNYSNCDFADIRFTGGTDGTVSVVGDCGGNTGITVDTPTTVYWKTDGSTNYGMDQISQIWTGDNGTGSNNQVPLPQHTFRFTNNAFTATRKTINPVAGFRVGGLDFTGVSNTPTLGTTAFECYGSLTCGTMTITGTANAITLKGRGSYTITLVATRSRKIVIDAYNGTYTLQDTFNNGTSSTQSILSLVRGTLDDGSQSVVIGSYFDSAYSTTRTLVMGNNNTWEIKKTTQYVWNISTSTNMSLTKGTGASTIKFTGALTGTIWFYGGGLSYNNIWNATTNAYNILIYQDNTFNDIKSDTGRLWLFRDATTQHITTFTFLGTSGAGVITIRNDNSASQKFNLVKDGGGVISGVDYLDIQYCAATPANTWYVGSNSITDNANNTGLIFSTMLTKSLSDSVTLSDSAGKSPHKNLADTVTISELFSYILTPGGGGLTKNLGDTVTFTDAISKAISMARADSISMTDSLGKSPNKKLADSTTITDGILKNLGKHLSDTVNNADSHSARVGKALSDTANFTDNFSRIVSFLRTLNDTTNFTDSLSQAFSKSLGDNVSFSDLSIKRTGKVLADTVTLSDNVDFLIAFLLSLDDTVTLTDSLTKDIRKRLSDNVSISDSFSKVAAYLRSLGDTVTITDSTVKGIAKKLSETVTLTDYYTAILTIILSLNETVYLTDDLSKMFGLHKSDAITISDSFSKVASYYRTLNETVTITDLLTKGISKELADTLTVTDLISLSKFIKYFYDAYLLWRG